MQLEFLPVESDEQIKILATLADDIWHEYWPGTLSYAQVDYMVEKFQSIASLTKDIRENNYEYWILQENSRTVGYTGGRAEKETQKFFISKIYLYANERGKGFASQVINFYEQICQKRNLATMYLTVNKYNELGIRAYVAKNFQVVDSVVTSIGKGFVMDDFVMEKHLESDDYPL